MSVLPPNAASAAALIDGVCDRAERLAAEAVEDFRLDRRTLTTRPDADRLAAEFRDEIERALRAAVRLGAPLPDAEHRFEAVYQVGQTFLYWVPMIHRIGDPPGTG